MQRLPFLLILGLLLPLPLLRAAPDSPSFVVQNQLLAPGSPLVPAPAPSDRVTLADGRVLTVRLEGAVLSARLADADWTVLDPRASAGCPPALAAFADNSALLIWRGHSADGAHDLRNARFIDGAWQPPATLITEDWRPASAPSGEGPALDHRGPHVVVAWFTAADGPRIHVSTSSSAGAQWLIPQRVDDITPVGRVSVVLLDDGSQLVSWVERLDGDHVILLRRISPRGSLSVPVQLVRQSADPGHPRLTRLKDGGATPAQLLLTYTSPASDLSTLNSQPSTTPASTRLITLPDAALLAEVDACDCDPRPEDQRGYGLKARILSVDPKTGTITLAHEAIPGVMPAATTAFKAAPDLLAAAQKGKRILARTERLGPDWWLLNLRPLLQSPTQE